MARAASARLAARLSEADNASFDGIDLPEFTRWAIEGRYPDDLDDAGRADAVLAIALALHRRSSGRTVNGQLFLRGGGHGDCAVVATVSARWWPPGLRVLGEGLDSFSGGCLLEADAVSGGEAEVGVVEEPVHGGAGECFGHDFVES